MFQIIIKETKDFLRDSNNVFFFLIFPVILVFLLGNLLSSLDSAEETIGEVRIHYLIETEDLADIMAIEGFIKGIGDDKNIIFEPSDDIEASIDLAAKDNITAAVLFKNSPMEIHIYEGSNRIKNRTINAIMNGFTQVNKAIKVIAKDSPKALINLVDDEPDFIKQKDLGINRTMLDYYAITMMAMLSLMSIILGSMCFIGEVQDKTIRRLKLAPINQVKLFFSKVLGLVPQVILQLLILMVLSVFVFGANYATSFIDNLYLFIYFFVVSLTFISIGAVYGLLTNINPMAVIMPIIWIMMFLGGTYSKEVFVDGVTQAMPIYQIQEAAFDLAIFGRYGKANAIIIICFIITTIMLLIGALCFRRKEE